MSEPPAAEREAEPAGEKRPRGWHDDDSDDLRRLRARIAELKADERTMAALRRHVESTSGSSDAWELDGLEDAELPSIARNSWQVATRIVLEERDAYAVKAELGEVAALAAGLAQASATMRAAASTNAMIEKVGNTIVQTLGEIAAPLAEHLPSLGKEVELHSTEYQMFRSGMNAIDDMSGAVQTLCENVETVGEHLEQLATTVGAIGAHMGADVD